MARSRSKPGRCAERWSPGVRSLRVLLSTACRPAAGREAHFDRWRRARRMRCKRYAQARHPARPARHNGRSGSRTTAAAATQVVARGACTRVGPSDQAGVVFHVAAVVAVEAADGGLSGGDIDSDAEGERGDGGKRECFQFHGRSLLSMGWVEPRPFGLGPAASAFHRRCRSHRSYARIPGASATAVALRRSAPCFSPTVRRSDTCKRSIRFPALRSNARLRLCSDPPRRPSRGKCGAGRRACSRRNPASRR